MAFDPHRNLAYSTVAIAPVPGISGTTVTLQAGDGAKFVAGLNVLVWPAGTSRALISNAEIARVSLITGDVLTLVRATTTEPIAIGPRAIVVGDQIANAITAKSFVDLESALAGFLPLAGGTLTGDLKFTDASFDIGKAGATRPRDLFLSRNAIVGGTIGVTGIGTFGAAIDVSAAGAGQFIFPATQNPSSGANVFDDYEEGSFTPHLIGTTSGEATYSTQLGRYRKVGKWADVYIYIATATIGTLVGNLRLSGLPFTSAGNLVNGVLLCPHFTTLGSNAISLGGFVGTSLTTIDINRITASAASYAAAPVATVGASEFVFFVHYETAN